MDALEIELILVMLRQFLGAANGQLDGVLEDIVRRRG